MFWLFAYIDMFSLSGYIAEMFELDRFSLFKFGPFRKIKSINVKNLSKISCFFKLKLDFLNNLV